MLENLGLSGFAMSGADVSGFAGTPTPDLMTKWIEIASFQPIDRDHSEKGTGDKEPWVGGTAQEAIRRHFIETRYELMPYLYTLVEEASRTGLPLERPLFLEFPDATPDRHPIDLDVAASGEFLLGPDLLVAPPPFPDEMDEYQAELPGSGWYDFWTGERVHAHALPPPVTASVDPVSKEDATQLSAVGVTPLPRRASGVYCARRRHPAHGAARSKHRRNSAGTAHAAHLRGCPVHRKPLPR